MKLEGINKSKFNLSIDILMFILLLAMAGIGFLMKYVLVSGEVRNVIYGSNVDLELNGLTRHEWGSIHLTISIIFLALLVLHIILHWKLIIAILKSMFPSPFIRYGIAGILFIFGLITLVYPFILEPEKVPFEPKYRNRLHNVPSSENIISGKQERELPGIRQTDEKLETVYVPVIQKESGTANHTDHDNSEFKEFEVYGYQTLGDVADRYKIPVAVICSGLNIPDNLTNEKFGWLRRRYSFTMTDVRKIISDSKKLNEQ
jgi:hypothetical protein